ncbi:MAG TPA: DUF4097 family beta strand repeat-containing protein, partial [Planctomycetota bacterium]|nr:DUF4097 family beta strand repeat-containing protein [Planctomycetota bacterium]
VEARSSSGKVSVRAYEGSKAKEPWSLVSGYGSIVLEAPADFACTLDARTSYGSVESDLPIATDAGKPAKGSLRGAVNGGGERVKLESASGSISIRSRGV